MIVIGTRGSRLALAQANWVSSTLASGGVENRVQVIETKGDVVQDRFDKMEGKGFFTGEIEAALHRGDIDLAVHCLKDLPTSSPEGLKIAAIPEREDPLDVIVSANTLEKKENGLPNLDELRIGTSSNRRVFGLKHHYPSATFVPIRGNVPTRIQKMIDGQADVVILAAAGLNRLAMDLTALNIYAAPPPLLVPAPGQGALALQTRSDSELDLSAFHHEETARCVGQERRVLAELEGGCQLPLGVLIRRNEDRYHLDLFLGNLASGFAGKSEARMFISFEGASPEALTEEALTILLHPVFQG